MRDNRDSRDLVERAARAGLARVDYQAWARRAGLSTTTVRSIARAEGRYTAETVDRVLRALEQEEKTA